VTTSASCLWLASPTYAQSAEPIGIKASRSNLSHAQTLNVAAPSSARPYVIGGAIVGALAAGVGLAIYFNQSDEEFLASPFVFVPLFVVSAGVGAGIGYLLYPGRG
jgi:hypothetical protein